MHTTSLSVMGEGIKLDIPTVLGPDGVVGVAMPNRVMMGWVPVSTLARTGASHRRSGLRRRW